MNKNPSNMSNKRGKRFIHQVPGEKSTKKQMSQSGKVPQRWARAQRGDLETKSSKNSAPHPDKEWTGTGWREDF